MKRIRSKEFKAKVLSEIAPNGFDAHAFSDDLHMIQKPTVERPTARIMTRDGGWIELDLSGRTIRTWGPAGRAQVLASALASHLGAEVEHLAKTGSVRADAVPRRVLKQSEDTVQSLILWWKLRGYAASSAPNGCWVNAGNARILDTGGHLEIHGEVTDEAVAAMIAKARDAWGGGLCLDGPWTGAEQDRMWIAAQRAGIDIQNCRASQAIQSQWAREQAAAAAKTKTISAIRSVITDAKDIIDAAKGDLEAAKRLPQALQAFVGIHLDDDQRRHLAVQPVAAVIPELENFRKLGVAELESYVEPDRKRNIFRPNEGKQPPDHTYVPQ